MDIDADKARAVLEQLEAEKQRRREQKVESGEVVVVPLYFVLQGGEDDAAIEELKAELLAEAKAKHAGRKVIPEFTAILTGVPRADGDTPSNTSGAEGSRLLPEVAEVETPAPVASVSATSLEVSPRHICTTIANGSDDGLDPGRIAEGVYSVERGVLFLTDLDGLHIASKPLSITDDPSAVARRLLRERAQNNFGSPINYPKIHLA
jgi:hypothetical protein